MPYYRPEDSLEELDLCVNYFGDIDLDQLVLVLGRSRNLSVFRLSNCGIGRRGCTLLARLLENQESNLKYLHLGAISIDDESVVVLADSLSKNTELEYIALDRNNGITSAG